MNRHASFAIRLAAVAAIVSFAACGEDPPLPGPGTLTATLVSPNGDEGAAIVALFGDGIQSVSGISPTQVFPRINGEGARIVLVNLGGGLLEFRVALADMTQKPDVVVVQVAGPDDELRADMTGYDVELIR